MHERWWFTVHPAIVVTLFAFSILPAASASQESIRFTACDDNRGYCVTSDQCSVRTFPSPTSRCPRYDEVCCPKSSIPSANDLPTGRCGVRKTQVNKLIFGGRRVPDGKWPWHAAIARRTGRNSEIVCGGSIIDRLSILTAAHCLYEQSGVIARYRVLVHVGRTHQFSTHSLSKTYKPDHFIVHPGYIHNSVKHDIALIKLENEIEMNDFVQPVCLWPTATDHERVVGRTGHVVGFGLHNQTHMSDDLLEAEVPVVDLINCLESNRGVFGTTLTSQMLCAGALDGVGPCNGDSGGGFYLEINNVWYIRAIVSFAPNLYGESVCDPEQYTIYTDVHKYMEWISGNHYEHIPPIGQPNQPDTTSPSSASSPNALLPEFATENFTYSKCGQRNPDGVVQHKVQKKFRAEYGEFPWTVALFKRAEKLTFCCNGALIGERAVLTTGHCVILCGNSTSEIVVRVGEWNISTPMPIPWEEIVVKDIQTHLLYKHMPQAYNIALLKLEHPVQYRATVQPVCLPTAAHTLSTDKKMIASGWSNAPKKQHSTTHQVQKQFNLLHIELQTCKDNFQSFVNQIYATLLSSVMCVTSNSSVHKRISDKEEGSPVVVKVSDEYQLHGLVSWGFKFKEEVVRCTVLTDVDYFISWIKRMMDK